MPNENTEQLQKITKLFNYDKILTKDDVDSVLGALVKILAKNKESYEEATKGHKENNQALFQQVVDAHHQLRQEITQQLQDHKNTLSAESEQKLTQALSRMDEVADRVEQMIPNIPKDGKDADPDAIIDTVLARIKLPEAKEAMQDTPEQVIQKIASVKGKKRLHIKNIDGVSELQDAIVNHTVGEVRRGLLYAGLVDGSKTTGGSGTGGYTVETPTGTVDGANTTFTVTATPVYIVSDGTTYFANNGYTISGLTITMSVPPTGYIRSFHV